MIALVGRPMTRGWAAILSAVIAAISYGADLALPKSTTVPLADQSPVLDGRLTDPCWETASTLTNFISVTRPRATADMQPLVRLTRDESALLLAIALPAPPRKLSVSVDPLRTHDDFYTLTISPDGTIHGSEHHRLLETERMISRDGWGGEAKVVALADENRWVAELRLPLASFRPEEQESLKSGAAFGLQIVLHGEVESTWSATWDATDPADFGAAVLGDVSTTETTTTWRDIPRGLTPATIAPRPTYTFTSRFDFGSVTMVEAGALDDLVALELETTDGEVGPETRYSAETGYGFLEPGTRSISTHTSGGHSLSALAADAVTSRETAVFAMTLPRGEFEAVLIVGTPSATAPIDMTVRVEDVTTTIRNRIPGRYFQRETIHLTSTGTDPVMLHLSAAPGTRWALNAILVYPRAERSKAQAALWWVERDLWHSPFETWLQRAGTWVTQPNGEDGLRDEERAKGFAAVSLPAAQYVPVTYIPKAEDGRTTARLITSPRRRSSVHVGIYAVEPIRDLQIEATLPDTPGIQLTPLMMRSQIMEIGRTALGQVGEVPRTLWRPEPCHLAAGRFQSFYVLADVAPETAAGVHLGRIQFRSGTITLADLELRITVLPTPVTRGAQVRSMYYHPPLFAYDHSVWMGYTDAEKALVIEDTRLQLIDMKRHGIDQVHTTGLRDSYTRDDEGLWHFEIGEREQHFLALLKELDMREYVRTIPGFDYYSPGPFIINEALAQDGQPLVTDLSGRGATRGHLPDSLFDTVTRLTQENIAYRTAAGVPIPAFEIWDEPGHVSIDALVPFLHAIRRGGGRTSVTLIPASFPAATGLVDVKNYSGSAIGVAGSEAATPAEISAHRENESSLYDVYFNHTMMGRDPRRARLAYGTWAWAWGLDGLNPYKYWKISGDPLLSASFHPIIFDAHGRVVVTTPTWEIHADGIYDNDLLCALEAAIVQPGADLDAARAASEYLGELRTAARLPYARIMRGFLPMTGMPTVDDANWPASRFDQIRAELASHLMRLTASPDTPPSVMQELAAVSHHASDIQAAITARQDATLPPLRTGNLLANGDFEHRDLVDKVLPAGFYRWSKQATIQSDLTRTGTGALRFEHTQPVEHDNVRFARVRVVPGRTYRLTAWVKRDALPADVSPNTGFWLHTFSATDDSTFVRRLPLWLPTSVPTHDWTQVTLDFTAADPERFVRVWFYNTDSQSIIFLDDIVLDELPLPGI